MDDTDLHLNIGDFYFDHFQHNDTAKDEYKTPLGSNVSSPNGNESESIEVVETPSNTYRGPLQESTISSASTNTDICVLDSHYINEDIEVLPDYTQGTGQDGDVEEFMESEEVDKDFLHAVDVLDYDEDFTVLHKPTKTRRLCNCEESTKVLTLINSEYQENGKPTYSGTDSDVEVLVSEDINESDWSSSNGLGHCSKKNSLLKKTNALKSNLIIENEDSSLSGLQLSYDVNSLKTQASTDNDVSSEELVDVSMANEKYKSFNRTELLQVIQKQELCIQALEAKVERYQKAQQRLFDHVDALRLELSEIRITPLQNVE